MAELRIGDSVKCLRCGNEFILSSNSFLLTPYAEVVRCPHCNADVDAFEYLLDMVERKESAPEIMDLKIEKFCGRWCMRIKYSAGEAERYGSMFLE